MRESQGTVCSIPRPTAQQEHQACPKDAPRGFWGAKGRRAWARRAVLCANSSMRAPPCPPPASGHPGRTVAATLKGTVGSCGQWAARRLCASRKTQPPCACTRFALLPPTRAPPPHPKWQARRYEGTEAPWMLAKAFSSPPQAPSWCCGALGCLEGLQEGVCFACLPACSSPCAQASRFVAGM